MRKSGAQQSLRCKPAWSHVRERAVEFSRALDEYTLGGSLEEALCEVDRAESLLKRTILAWAKTQKL